MNAVNELLKSGEGLHLEVKEAKNEVPRSIWETYSAFANTDGGVILLGIKENFSENDLEKRFEIISVQNPDKIFNDFWNTLNNPEKVSFNLLMDKDVEIIIVEDKPIIKINVPAASYENKPIYIHNNPYSGTYLRNHQGDYKASKDIVNEMIRDSQEKSNDSKLVEGFTFDDIDISALERYHQEFNNSHKDHVWKEINNLEFLEKLGGFSLDRKTGEKWLTEAGLLMFGKGQSIREYFDTLQMDYLDQTNLLPGERWSNRINIDGSWENNLYNFIKLIIPELTKDLKNPFIMNGLQRIEDSPVKKAVREAVINMIIHSDYKIWGTLKIIKKDNGFFFSNPGSLKIPIKEIFHGGYSRARNQNIQKMLELIGYGESIGSGFLTILTAWKEQNWRLPEFKYNATLNQVELSLWTLPLISIELEENLKELYCHSYESFTEIQKLILLSTGIEDGVTKSRLIDLIDVNKDEFNKDLGELVENKYLKVNQYQGESVYIVNPEIIENERNNKIKNEKIIQASYHFKSPNLNNSEEKILNYLENHEFITNNKVLEITNIKTRQGASKTLNQLTVKGILDKRKSKKSFHYFLKQDKINS